jgi:hypothetical protein
VKPTYKRIVRSRSSRNGIKPVLLVLHTTEGPGDALLGLASYFDNIENQASSHVANNHLGESVRMVPDFEKAWTCSGYNSLTLNIEQMGFASSNKAQWFKRCDKQLSNTAAWLAEWSVAYRIPLRKGRASSSFISVSRSGVVQHKDLGTVGGGHSDCGSGYPQRYVVRLARLIVLEHHLGTPDSKEALRLRKRINRQRKRYGLHPFKSPAKATR